MSFQVLPPDGTTETQDANWRNLNQSYSVGAFNPVPPTGGPTISGTGVLVQGYSAQILANVIFFNITMSASTGNVTLSWGTGGTVFLNLPATIKLLGSGTVNYPYYIFPVVSNQTGVSYGNVSITNNGKQGVLTNNGAAINAAEPTLSIQGFYFAGK